ncbi:MAG: hypothetical protein V1897_05800 [Pseudomonadota bacterium]
MTISRDEYKNIIQSQLDGKVTIMIDAAVWRQFLVKADPQKLQALVNRPMSGRLGLLRILSIIDIPLLLLCVGISIPAVGWWTAATGPIILLGGFLYRGRASIGRQSLGAVSVVFILAITAVALQPTWTFPIKALVLSLATTFFLIRFLYVFTVQFVFGLIHSSYEFFSEFYLKPADKLGDVAIPFIWTEPEYEPPEQE